MCLAVAVLGCMTLPSQSMQTSYDSTESMAPPMTPQPKWERKLILSKTQWPNKYAAYTVG